MREWANRAMLGTTFHGENDDADFGAKKLENLPGTGSTYVHHRNEARICVSRFTSKTQAISHIHNGQRRSTISLQRDLRYL